MSTVMHDAFDVLKEKVDALDLGPIKFKLMDKDEGQGWTRERADIVEGEYRNFLILTGLDASQPSVPFGDIDTFWHQHILDTRKYAGDCQAAFGKFLHHFPYLGLRGKEDKANLDLAGEATQVRYAALFGSRMGGERATCDKCCGAFEGDEKLDTIVRVHDRPTV